MNEFLIQDRPIMFLPRLAIELKSVEKAIILQQIHWLLCQPKNGIWHDGEHWVWGSYEQWCEDYFPMWKPSNLRSHIVRLEKAGYLISEQIKAKDYNHTKFYRVNYAKFCESMRYNPSASERQDPSASLKTETSSENSPSYLLPVSKDLPSEDKAPLRRASAKFEEFWSKYPKKVAKGKAIAAWRKQKCDTIATRVLESLEWHEALKRDREYIPYPASWLNARSWEDDVDNEREAHSRKAREALANWKSENGK